MNRLIIVLAAVSATVARSTAEDWTAAEIDQLRDFSLEELGPPPADPSNRYADDPQAAELGRKLFFDTRLSVNGQVSCATCHQPERDFQDGLPLSQGVGTTGRRAMPIAGTSHLPFLFWDGRKDSQWAQALGPLESPVEHGGTRAQYAHVIADHYRAEYEKIFGRLPDLSSIPAGAGPVADADPMQAWLLLSDEQRDNVTTVFVNIGKAIAAYERRIAPGESRFDIYLERLLATGRPPADILNQSEEAGLRLFVGRGNCVQCHNGPLFTNGDFHNTGVPARRSQTLDRGRAAGASQVRSDEFNRHSRWSDAPAASADIDFIKSDGAGQERAFKVPSLRNVAERAPYMHAGQISTLADVLRHYNEAPLAPAGHTELKPLHLDENECAQLEAFLRSLSAPPTYPRPGLGEVAAYPRTPGTN